MFNFSTRKVGGIRFIKLGRLSLSFCVCRSAVPLGHKRSNGGCKPPLRNIKRLRALLAIAENYQLTTIRT